MLWQTLGKFLAFSVGGCVIGIVAAAVAGYVLQNYLGGEALPLVWLTGGLAGLIVGASQVSWRKRRRRRRRRRPQVVLPPMKTAFRDVQEASSGGPSTGAGAQIELIPGEPAALFQQATGATAAELTNVRVCDVRLDGDGEPLGVRLTQNGQEREVFLVHDHHRAVVAEALEAALRREPGNRRARLFP